MGPLENKTSPRHIKTNMLCKIDMRFWKITSSASIARRELIARTSFWYCSRCVSSSITVDCQSWSYCWRKSRSSLRTVLLRYSRNVVVLDNCRCSTRPKASRRFLDCSSMYCNDKDELDSSIWRRFCTDLKKDSWIVGLASGGCVEEVAVLVCSACVALVVLISVLRFSALEAKVFVVVLSACV